LLTFAIAVVLFFPGLLLHESLHLVVLQLIGGQGVLIIRPWAFALIDLSLPSLHVQPVPGLDVGRQLVLNFFGPALAAGLFAVPLLYVRDRRWRLALIANVGVLVFYALIEAGYVLADVYLHLELGVLVTPEFNYGVPLAIYIAAALAAAFGRPRSQGRSAALVDGVRDDPGHRRDEVRPGVE
jgi:hypothetical protein